MNKVFKAVIKFKKLAQISKVISVTLSPFIITNFNTNFEVAITI